MALNEIISYMVRNLLTFIEAITESLTANLFTMDTIEEKVLIYSYHITSMENKDKNRNK